MPNRRPWTTWRLYVFRYVSRKNSRSSGVGRGQLAYTLNRRAVRGFPSRRHAAICSWNAASQGGTSCENSSSVRPVKSRNSVGRDCRSVNRKPAMGRASCHYIVISRRIIPERKRDKLNDIGEALLTDDIDPSLMQAFADGLCLMVATKVDQFPDNIFWDV